MKHTRIGHFVPHVLLEKRKAFVIVTNMRDMFKYVPGQYYEVCAKQARVFYIQDHCGLSQLH